MPPWIPRLILLVILAAFAAYAAVALLGRLRDLLIWLITALFLSFALEPAVNWLAKRGWRRGLATGAVLFGLALIFLTMIGLMIPLLVDQVQQLVNELPGWIHRAQQFANQRFGLHINTEQILKRVTSAQIDIGNMASNVASVGATILGVVFQMLTIFLFTFYLVADGPRLRRSVCSVLTPRRQREVLDIWEVAIDKTGGYLYSRLLLAALSALFSFIVLMILGVPFALPLALWMGFVSQFIPVIGTYIAAAVPLLVALLSDPWSALIFLIYVVIYQQIENYLFSPRITARTMQLHPAVAFFAALAGGLLNGVVGAFLALPAAAIIQAIISSYLTRHEVVETELTRESPGEPSETSPDPETASGEPRGPLARWRRARAENR
ncbi:MAG TPA: AI-2E family transporter [Actinomycetota bacterium]|nr:AI-2E family transporter [Actinomycetota bacterium]